MAVDDPGRVYFTLSMRSLVLILLAALALTGCRSARPGASPEPVDGKKKSPRPAQGSTRGPRAVDAPIQVTPVMEGVTRIVFVNSALRYVVIDFFLNPLPQVDQRMSAYRGGLKVAELKISRESTGSHVAADILAGEVQVGDEVRAN